MALAGEDRALRPPSRQHLADTRVAQEYKTPLVQAARRFDRMVGDSQADWGEPLAVKFTTSEAGGLVVACAASSNAAQDFVVAKIRIASCKNPLRITAAPLARQCCLMLSYGPPARMHDFAWLTQEAAGEAGDTLELRLKTDDEGFRVGVYYLYVFTAGVPRSFRISAELPLPFRQGEVISRIEYARRARASLRIITHRVRAGEERKRKVCGGLRRLPRGAPHAAPAEAFFTPTLELRAASIPGWDRRRATPAAEPAVWGARQRPESAPVHGRAPTAAPPAPPWGTRHTQHDGGRCFPRPSSAPLRRVREARSPSPEEILSGLSCDDSRLSDDAEPFLSDAGASPPRNAHARRRPGSAPLRRSAAEGGGQPQQRLAFKSRAKAMPLFATGGPSAIKKSLERRTLSPTDEGSPARPCAPGQSLGDALTAIEKEANARSQLPQLDLQVKVVQCKGLNTLEGMHSADPYVILRLVDTFRGVVDEQKTPVMRMSTDPYFHARFRLNARELDRDACLEVCAMHHSVIAAQHPTWGAVSIPLKNLVPEKLLSRWHLLQNGDPVAKVRVRDKEAEKPKVCLDIFFGSADELSQIKAASTVAALTGGPKRPPNMHARATPLQRAPSNMSSVSHLGVSQPDFSTPHAAGEDSPVFPAGSVRSTAKPLLSQRSVSPGGSPRQRSLPAWGQSSSPPSRPFTSPGRRSRSPTVRLMSPLSPQSPAGSVGSLPPIEQGAADTEPDAADWCARLGVPPSFFKSWNVGKSGGGFGGGGAAEDLLAELSVDIIGVGSEGFNKLAASLELRATDLLPDAQTLNLEALPAASDDLLRYMQTTRSSESSGDVGRLLLRGCCRLSASAIAEFVSHFRSLSVIDLSGCEQVDDEFLLKMAPYMKGIKKIKLSQCIKVSSEGLSHLALHCHEVRTFDCLGCVRVDGSGLMHVARGFPKLVDVCVQGCHLIESEAVDELITQCKQLSRVSVAGLRKLSSEVLQRIAKELGERLRSLDVGLCDGVSDELLQSLGARCAKLESLSVHSSKSITDKGLLALSAGCWALKTLVIVRCARISDFGVVPLVGRCKLLEAVSLNHTRVTDDSVIGLVDNCPNISSISVRGCTGISLVSIESAVKYCKNLRALDHAGSNVDDDVVKALCDGRLAPKTEGNASEADGRWLRKEPRFWAERLVRELSVNAGPSEVVCFGSKRDPGSQEQLRAVGFVPARDLPANVLESMLREEKRQADAEAHQLPNTTFMLRSKLTKARAAMFGRGSREADTNQRPGHS